MRAAVFILLCCLLISGCHKHPLDYRNKYLGNYAFSVHQKTWILYGDSTDTTYTYNGNIVYGTYDDHAIKINFSAGTSVEPILYEDGSMSTPNLSGAFESTNKLHFFLDIRGLGGGTSYDVSGEKIK